MMVGKNFLLFVSLLVIFAAGCSEEGDVSDGGKASAATAPETTAAPGEFSRTFSMINDERRKKKVSALISRSDLVELARAHSEYQARTGKLTHRDGRGMEVDGRLDLYKIKWSSCGENVGRNKGFEDYEKKAVESWMASPGHRKNILNRDYKYTGVYAIKGADGYYYFTQVFLAE